MTVRELINSLLDMPMDAVVVSYNSEEYKLDDLTEDATLYKPDWSAGNFVKVGEPDNVGTAKNVRTGEQEEVVVIW